MQGHSPVDQSRSPPGVLSRQSVHVGASGCYSLRRGILLSTSPGCCQVCQRLSLKLRSRPVLTWVLRPLPNWQAQLAGLVFLADQFRSASEKFTSFSDVTVSTCSLGVFIGCYSQHCRGILPPISPGRRQGYSPVDLSRSSPGQSTPLSDIAVSTRSCVGFQWPFFTSQDISCRPVPVAAR